MSDEFRSVMGWLSFFVFFCLFFWGFSSVFWSLASGRVLSIGVLAFFGLFFLLGGGTLFQGGGQHQNDTGGLLRLFFDRHFPSRLPNTHFNSPSFYPWGLHGGVDILGTIPPLSRSKKFFLGLSLSRLLLHEHHRHIGIRVLDLHQSDWLLDKTHSASWFTTKYISIPRPKHHITSYNNPPVIFGDFDSTPAQLQPEFERNDHPRSGNKQHKGPPQSPL